MAQPFTTKKRSQITFLVACCVGGAHLTLLMFLFLFPELFSPYNEVEAADASEQLVTSLTVWWAVLLAGSLLLLAVWYFPSLRISKWFIPLILLGAILGTGLSLLPVSNQFTCCLVTYHIVNGYPLPVILRIFSLDYPLLWPEVYAYMQRHPEQVGWDYSLIPLVGNGLFYACVTFILIFALHSGIKFIIPLKKHK